jgi:hypothetical protein
MFAAAAAQLERDISFNVVVVDLVVQNYTVSSASLWLLTTKEDVNINRVSLFCLIYYHKTSECIK